jgi:hypothetical protein
LKLGTPPSRTTRFIDNGLKVHREGLDTLIEEFINWLRKEGLDTLQGVELEFDMKRIWLGLLSSDELDWLNREELYWLGREMFESLRREERDKSREKELEKSRREELDIEELERPLREWLERFLREGLEWHSRAWLERLREKMLGMPFMSNPEGLSRGERNKLSREMFERLRRRMFETLCREMLKKVSREEFNWLRRETLHRFGGVEFGKESPDTLKRELDSLRQDTLQRFDREVVDRLRINMLRWLRVEGLDKLQQEMLDWLSEHESYGMQPPDDEQNYTDLVCLYTPPENDFLSWLVTSTPWIRILFFDVCILLTQYFLAGN